MMNFQIVDYQLYECDDNGNAVKLLNAEDSFAVVRSGGLSNVIAREEFQDITLTIVQTTGLLAVKAHVQTDSGEVELNSLKDCPAYLIVGGAWIPISPGSIAEASELLLEVDVREIGDISVHQAMYLFLHGRRIRPAIRHDWDYSIVTTPSELTPVPLMSATPYPYQKLGFEWLSWLKSAGVGGLLGDEMGLGKTLQIIMLLQQEIRLGNVPNLVVCPPSLLENWRREVFRFIGVDVYIHQGNKRRFDQENFENQKIVVVSYDAVRRDYLYLKKVNWNVIAVDEAQYIKNPESQRAVSLMQLPKKMGVAVTGTPIENSLDDLWSLMNFSCEGLLGSQEWFRSTFEDSTESLNDLRKMIKPLILRRRVSEVLTDLPAIRIQDVPISFPAEMLEEYLSIDISQSRSFTDAFRRISKQRKISNHLSDSSESDYFSSRSGKLEYLQNTLHELEQSNSKAIIFAPYTKTINELARWSQERFHFSFVESIYGATAIEDRQTIVDRFTAHEGFGVLIMNPKAGGVGLNITTANHVFHFSPDWNPAVIDQANSRAYRMGQTKPVTVHNLFYAGSIEEYMLERLERKRELSEDTLKNTSMTPTLEELNEALMRRPRVLA
jgi:SNF2 family DNA or RNA helicase